MVYGDQGDMEWEDQGEIDLSIVRRALCDELDGIDEYQDHISDADSEEAIRVLEEILDGKKDTVARLVKLLGQLDAEQGAKFKQHGIGA